MFVELMARRRRKSRSISEPDNRVGEQQNNHGSGGALIRFRQFFRCCCGSENNPDQHRASIILVVSSGAAKITEALPIIPAGIIAGAPFSGPSLLESVLNRKLRSQKARVLPSAVVTR
jgi:hypothetical protein